MKRALVVGSTGQDGSYLVETLRVRDYSVTGISRGSVSRPPTANLACIDIQDDQQVPNLFCFNPDEIYHLTAFHHSSEDLPLGVHN